MTCIASVWSEVMGLARTEYARRSQGLRPGRAPRMSWAEIDRSLGAIYALPFVELTDRREIEAYYRGLFEGMGGVTGPVDYGPQTNGPWSV